MSIVVFYYLLYFSLSLYIGYKTWSKSFDEIPPFIILFTVFIVFLGFFSEQWVLFILLVISSYVFDLIDKNFPEHIKKPNNIINIIDGIIVVGFSFLILWFKFGLHFNWNEYLGLN